MVRLDARAHRATDYVPPHRGVGNGGEHMIGPDAHEEPLRHRVRAPPTPSHHRREPSPEVAAAAAAGRGAGPPWGSSGIPRTVGLGLGLGLVAVAGCRLGAAGPGRRRGRHEASHQGRGAGTGAGAPADGDEAHPRTPRVKDDPGSAGAADAEDAAAVNE